VSPAKPASPVKTVSPVKDVKKSAKKSVSPLKYPAKKAPKEEAKETKKVAAPVVEERQSRSSKTVTKPEPKATAEPLVPHKPAATASKPKVMETKQVKPVVSAPERSQTR